MIARQSRLRGKICVLLLLGVSINDGRSAELMTPREDVTHGGPDLAWHDACRSVADREGAAPARRPFDGFWAADRAACLNPDSDERMAIETDTIAWYETRCRIGAIAPAGRKMWHLGLTCRGEGQRITARATVSLPTIDTLIIDDGPIGPARRQRYIRCEPQ